MYARAVNAFSATRAGTWVVRHVAARLDPAIFARTDGRFTLTVRPTLPMLTLTVPGRRTGTPRRVQLAYLLERGDGTHGHDGTAYLVVGSAMGQDHDPDWVLNLRASARAWVRLPGRVEDVTAVELTAEQTERVWPALETAIPQLRTYKQRTTRVIPVMRLVPDRALS
jgi:deazaflavin-dependent oxidoreductase (nitroreductase family)